MFGAVVVVGIVEVVVVVGMVEVVVVVSVRFVVGEAAGPGSAQPATIRARTNKGMHLERDLTTALSNHV
jgi:hypothetical protein